ncbi:MAG TPA: DUF4383 domain-containing protein [Actinomycetota bacterium]|nr:DUF4383 domain-containing protein [Actinomycetota bacterium]
MSSSYGSRTPAQFYALVFGAIYALVGIVGFFVSGQSFLNGTADEKLIAFPVNYMHDIIHLAIGAVLLFAASRADLAKTMNLVVGVVLLLVAVLGFMGVLTPTLINDHGVADDFLHLATGLLAVYFGTAGARGGVTTATGPAGTGA